MANRAGLPVLLGHELTLEVEGIVDIAEAELDVVALNEVSKPQ